MLAMITTYTESFVALD